MAGIKAASNLIKIGLLLFVIGTILYLAGFGSHAWKQWDGKSGRDHEVGLWKFITCYIGGSCIEPIEAEAGSEIRGRDIPSIRAARAFACIGLMCFFVNIILTLVFICIDTAHNRRVLIADALIAVIGVMSGIICCCIYAGVTDYDDISASVGWSQGLFILGFLINFAAFIVLLLDFLGKKI